MGRFSGAASPVGGLLYDPARLQREADRRNAAALRAGLTDAFCRCGHLAEFTWVGDDGREVWRCHECIPTLGRASLIETVRARAPRGFSEAVKQATRANQLSTSEFVRRARDRPADRKSQSIGRLKWPIIHPPLRLAFPIAGLVELRDTLNKLTSIPRAHFVPAAVAPKRGPRFGPVPRLDRL